MGLPERLKLTLALEALCWTGMRTVAVFGELEAQDF
jgi:hypothetical protein